MTAGLVRPAAGSVEVFGHDPVRDPVAARRRLGLLPDRPALPAGLTVRELLTLRAALYGVQDAESARSVAVLSAELGIAMLAVGWCTAAAGVPVIVGVLDELGLSWKPPALLATPWIPVLLLTGGLLLWAGLVRWRPERSG